jgi:hypothetical protein
MSAAIPTYRREALAWTDLMHQHARFNRSPFCLRKLRPHFRDALAADGADETLFQVGQPHVIGP